MTDHSKSVRSKRRRINGLSSTNHLFWVLMVPQRSGVDLPANLQNCLDRMKAMPSVIQAFAEEGLS